MMMMPSRRGRDEPAHIAETLVIFSQGRFAAGVGNWFVRRRRCRGGESLLTAGPRGLVFYI